MNCGRCPPLHRHIWMLKALDNCCLTSPPIKIAPYHMTDATKRSDGLSVYGQPASMQRSSKHPSRDAWPREKRALSEVIACIQQRVSVFQVRMIRCLPALAHMQPYQTMRCVSIRPLGRPSETMC